MALAGFLTFGEKTMGNVLNNFPTSNLMVNVARFCFGLNMLTTLPLEAFVCREVMLNYWYPGAPFDLWRHLAFTTLSPLRRYRHITRASPAAAVAIVFAVTTISDQGEDDRLYFGVSTMQGWRISMEDAHAAVLDLQPDENNGKTTPETRVSFFGVYDGHGGDKVALFSGQNVHKIVAKQADFTIGNFEKAMKDGFLACDRAILQGEKARITAAGGFVDFGRVNGNLALSRAIGDFEFKKSADLPPEQQIVTSFPDVVMHDLSDDDEFMVIACDGIWDCQSSQAVIEFVRRGIVEKQELHKICENMMDSCLAPSSENGGVGCDNMTMVVVAFLRGKTKEEWYEMVARRVSDGDGPCAPPDYYTNFEEEETGTIKSYGVTVNNTREGGRIIMLGDGTEVLTDSDDTEMFDYDEEEKDAEALDKDTSITETKSKPTSAQPGRGEHKSEDEAGSSKDNQTTDGKSSGPSLNARSI
ncbi:hypothetical protein Dda_8032 [Drechslerella dactyloides]|uniref:protein-serine/threonine phosphatase n=1 Tax=Drechslerella dactyloides TaxID=74499 RepID=A0AAD6IUS2_DREDA|nr:hypothetical protein Dda_8032 [Drechslerella dactyloides]